MLIADDAAYAHGLAEPLAALIVSLAPGYDAIVAPSTAAAKNVLPRAAALLDVMQVSDITKVLGPKTFERPIYAGNAIQTVESERSEGGGHCPHRLVRRSRPRRPGAGRKDRGGGATRACPGSSARRSPSPTGRS